MYPPQVQRLAFQMVHDNVTVKGEEWNDGKADESVVPKDRKLLETLRDVQGACSYAYQGLE